MMKNVLTISVVVVAVAFGWLYTNHPLLFGRKTATDQKAAAIVVFKDGHADLDHELSQMAQFIGDEYDAYRNHCLRVLTFAKYYLPEFVEQEIPNALQLAAVALAYHDVALWTDGALDYLEPSVAVMDRTLAQRQEEEAKFSYTEIKIMQEIIMQHHKWTDYNNHQEFSPAAVALINAVRKGDWADATFGLIRFGMPSYILEAAYEQIPELHFHDILMSMLPRLSPNSLIGQLEVLHILKW